MKLNLLLLIIIEVIRMALGTCVLESDFGFILNCNFKKSGLFRVRNLGGLKAHFGLGFSLGDELGFAESLGNLEGNRRRALNYRTGAGPNNIGVLPASKLPPVPPPPPIPSQATHKVQKSFPIALTPRPPVVQQMPATRTSSIKRSGAPLMTEAAYLPMGVPAFRRIPPTTPRPKIGQGQVAIQSNTANVAVNNRIVEPTPFQLPAKNLTIKRVLPMKSVSQNIIGAGNIPPFQALPSSLSRVSNTEIVEVESGFSPMIPPDVPKVDLMGHSVEELATAANVSVEAIKQAVFMRQQQLLTDYRATQIRNQLIRDSMTSTTVRTTMPTTTTMTTTTVMPTKRPTMKPSVASGKVMNAPKEYYPVGYDKNFDDNFTSKVDLPPTSFSCGDQKHFPGLYADVDLGCMVFHVCALTDDGLIMKSFLCPESTLFDQTILKCNWWFYVDCKSSKTLYDSNIPVSKSYQLMKSLTYFSNYNKNANKDKEELDIEQLKNTVVSELDTSSKPT